jgi:hypothetical protein
MRLLPHILSRHLDHLLSGINLYGPLIPEETALSQHMYFASYTFLFQKCSNDISVEIYLGFLR